MDSQEILAEIRKTVVLLGALLLDNLGIDLDESEEGYAASEIYAMPDRILQLIEQLEKGK